MFLDPRLVELAQTYARARDAYDDSIRDLAHPRQWNELSRAKQQEWYDGFIKESSATSSS